MTGRGLCVAAILILGACEKPAVAPESRPEPVVVYASYADESYLPALFATFTRQTGIPVTVRHREERQNVSEVIEKRGSPVADVLLTSSINGIWLAADEGALLPLQSEEIPAVVPDWLRDPDGYWTATAVATILIAYNEDDLDESSITGYDDLGKSDFRGRVCLSAPSLAVNRAMVANLIASHGVRPAEIIVRGWITNLALPAFESEADLLNAIDSGTCALGIVSSVSALAMGGASVSTLAPQRSYFVAEGAGVGRHTKSPDAARRLVEWLVSPTAQASHAARTGYYPTNRELRDRSGLPSEATGMNSAGIAGAYDTDAVKLAERASWR